jgi:AcrR family transcriptional regulator
VSDALSRQPLQQRVVDAIIDGAAEALAAQGEQASMAAVAAASGVARATVYRYFPNREALLAELADAGVARSEAALAAARIDEVDPHEGVRRAVRALVEVGDLFVALARSRHQLAGDEFERRLARRLRRLLERGQEEGAIRADVPSTWLTEALVGLVLSVLGARPALGREDAIAAVVGVFLHGADGRASHP